MARSLLNFQYRVNVWIRKCFTPRVVEDVLERGDRFLEEALELLQATDYPKERVALLVEYVYGRPVGEPSQEVGGTMVTLAALCVATNINLDTAAEAEITRIEDPEIMWKIRRKQASKPHGSALPGVSDGHE